MFWLNAAETWVDLNSNVADKVHQIVPFLILFATQLLI